MTDVPPSDDPGVTPPDLSAADAEASMAVPDAPLEPEAAAMTPPAITEPFDSEPPEPAFAEPFGGEPTGAAAGEPFGDATPPPSSPPPPSGPPPGQPSSSQQPPYVAPPVRRLYRSQHDRKVGGVSAGIAEYFAIDPTLVRLGTLAFIISGVGIFIYLIAWIIVPVRPDGMPIPRPYRAAAQDRTLTLALGLAALALAFGIVTDSWEVFAIALIGAGLWLLSEHTNGTAPALFTQSPATSPTAPSGAYGPSPQTTTTAYVGAATPPGFEPAGYGDTGGYGTPTYGTPQYPPPHSYVPAPAKPRKPQRITWIVLSLLALLTAIGIAAATGDWWTVSATRFLGVGVIIIGIGVVVGQLRNGGARGLIPLGLLAALALFPVSAVDGLVTDGFGETLYQPTTFTGVQESYNHGIGKLTVDLSALDFTGRSETIDIELGIGELVVVVPRDAGGQAVLQANAGEISHQLRDTGVFRFEEGVNIETGTVRLEGDQGTLDLNISVGLGTAELRSDAN